MKKYYDVFMILVAVGVVLFFLYKSVVSADSVSATYLTTSMVFLIWSEIRLMKLEGKNNDDS